uniref:NADH dehydrogenase [ubiquinone] iron-sulfur protein 5 n=1 Tax=Romanomermis culicivorax TaxID=13658 RepID=A0A915IHU2_ROMCU
MAVTPGPYGRLHAGIRIDFINDIIGTTFDSQGTPCWKFELNYSRCMDAFGLHLGIRHCDLEFRDFFECTHDDKKLSRFNTIRRQRQLQFLKGERPKPFLKGYPTPYHVTPDWYDENGIFY